MLQSIQKTLKKIKTESAQKFSLRNGVLFYRTVKNGYVKKADTCSTKLFRQLMHGDKLGGHFGRDKTREKITSMYNVNCFT